MKYWVLVLFLLGTLIPGCSLKLMGETTILERFNKPKSPVKEESSVVKKQTTTNTIENSEVSK